MGKFKINFSGMIGFVPNEDSSKPSVMAILVDGKYPHRCTDEEELFPHFPFVHYRLDDLADMSPRRPDLTGRGYGINFLNMEDLTIGSPSSDNLRYRLTEDFPKEPSHYGDSSGSRCGSKDLCWVMPIQKIGNFGGNEYEDLAISKDCLADTYHVTDKNRVVARLKLRTGCLYVDDFYTRLAAGEYMNTVCNFQSFPSGDPHHSQVISTVVTYEPEMTGDLKITSKRFNLPKGAAGGQFPELVFKGSDESYERTINIWNAPLADILDLLGGKEKHQWDRPKGDRSFRSYFRLCEKPPRKLPVMGKEEWIVAKVQSPYGENKKDVGCPHGMFGKAKF